MESGYAPINDRNMDPNQNNNNNTIAANSPFQSDPDPLNPVRIESDGNDGNDGNDEVMVKNVNYKFRHLASFNLTGFCCIAFVIFLTSSQPFYITQVLSIDSKNLGKIIGALGVADELTCIISSPLIGSLSDKITHMNWMVNGTKFIVVSGFMFIWASFYLYGLVSYQNWLQLIIPRMLFAIGVTSCMSMVPVLLHQLIHSDFKFSHNLFWKFRSENDDSNHISSNKKKNGRYSAMIGISTGLGAIFSVSFFLTLPVKLLADLDISSLQSLKLSFVIIGLISLLVAIVIFFFLYNSNTIPTETTRPSYLQLLTIGFSRFRTESSVQLACLGGFVARSTSVLIAVFVPLFVYNFYHKSGKCDDSDGSLSKDNCYDGYTFAAILTGVAQTISLISSPLWGWLIDKLGKSNCLIMSSIIGLLGNWLICALNLYDPRNAITFMLVALIGISQIGTIITSMSYISMENDSVGSISGVYNLCGGLGILILGQFGGPWSDSWILGPFFLLGMFHFILIVIAIWLRKGFRKTELL